MPITRLLPSRRTTWLAAFVLLAASDAAAANSDERPAVAVVRSATWSPNDTAREGAEELTVLMNLARVQHGHTLAGLVGVGNRNGIFQTGGEQALRFAVLSGVPVVKLAAGGEVAACPDELFISAGAMPEGDACRLLAQALERFGAPPRAVNPAHPTDAELAAIRVHVQRLQEHFAVARAPQVARN